MLIFSLYRSDGGVLVSVYKRTDDTCDFALNVKNEMRMTIENRELSRTGELKHTVIIFNFYTVFKLTKVMSFMYISKNSQFFAILGSKP